MNDNANVLLYLKEKGVDLKVICSRMCDLKTRDELSEYDEIEGIPIYRIYSNFEEQSSFFAKRYDQVCRIVQEFKPDIIFCSQQYNMFLAERINRNFNIPIVLLVEFAYDATKLVKRKWYLGLKPLAKLVGDIYWRWLSNNTKAIITSYIGDLEYLDFLSRHGVRTYYVPWCNHIPHEVSSYKVQEKQKRGIYIGAFTKWKNVHEFGVTIPLILEKTPTEEFVFIGPCFNLNVIEKLRKRYGRRINYVETISRIDALRFIKESFFSYTPVKFGGWGFIGDSWGVKTPLIATHNEYHLKDQTDALLVDDCEKIHLKINELYNNTGLYKILQRGGFKRYKENHSAQSVGENILRIFQSI